MDKPKTQDTANLPYPDREVGIDQATGGQDRSTFEGTPLGEKKSASSLGNVDNTDSEGWQAHASNTPDDGYSDPRT